MPSTIMPAIPYWPSANLRVAGGRHSRAFAHRDAVVLYDSVGTVATEAIDGTPALIESGGAAIPNHIWRVNACVLLLYEGASRSCSRPARLQRRSAAMPQCRNVATPASVGPRRTWSRPPLALPLPREFVICRRISAEDGGRRAVYAARAPPQQQRHTVCAVRTATTVYGSSLRCCVGRLGAHVRTRLSMSRRSVVWAGVAAATPCSSINATNPFHMPSPANGTAGVETTHSA